MASKRAKNLTVPLEAQATLRECSEDHLRYMSTIAASSDFQNLIDITRVMTDRNKDLVFAFDEAEPQKLAVFKANARGQVGGLTLLVYMFQGSSAELKRRNDNAKKAG